MKKVFDTVIIEIPESRQEYILSLFERMEEEYRERKTDKYADTMIKNYLAELFVFILRYNKRKSSGDIPEEIPEKEIQTAARFIYENYDKEITLSKVAEYVHMLNFSEYLVSTRMQRAEEILLNTSKSITEIAEMCGFSDANYFGDVFKKRRGVSPNKYRRFKGRM